MIQQIVDSKIVTQKPKQTRVSEIEAELDGLWSQFNENINGGETVMRACMSNLIIYCETDDEAEVIGQELITIVDAHPARVLLLVGKGVKGTKGLQACVAIYHTTVPDGLQVCAERIDVISNVNEMERLPSVARSQLIGDLPTALWWASRQTPPDAGDVFLELAELSDLIIYDNMGWVNPIKGVATMTRWVASQQDDQVVYNLAWRRTAIWRKLISQVLDPRVAPSALSDLRMIEIDHGPHALAMTWLLVGWLADRLNWKPVDGKSLSNSKLIWNFMDKGKPIRVYARRLPEGEPVLYRLLFDSSIKRKKRHICFERQDMDQIGIVETSENTTNRSYAAQIPKRAVLVSAQLAHRDRDKLFEHAVKSANEMTELFQK